MGYWNLLLCWLFLGNFWYYTMPLMGNDFEKQSIFCIPNWVFDGEATVPIEWFLIQLNGLEYVEIMLIINFFPKFVNIFSPLDRKLVNFTCD